jgi:hypothetical protein
LIDRDVLRLRCSPADLRGLVQSALDRDDVGMSRQAIFRYDALARRANAARVRFTVVASLAFESLRQSESRELFADAVRAFEQICMMHAIVRDRAPQRRDGGILRPYAGEERSSHAATIVARIDCDPSKRIHRRGLPTIHREKRVAFFGMRFAEQLASTDFEEVIAPAREMADPIDVLFDAMEDLFSVETSVEAGAIC